MPDTMTEITADVQAERAAAERQRLYAEHQQLASATAALNNAGMTYTQMKQAVVLIEDQMRDVAAFAAEQKVKRDLEARQQAAEQAEKERVEAEQRAATFKAQKLADWLAGGLGTEQEFNRQWDSIRLAIFAQGGTANDEAAAIERSKAEMRRHYSTIL